MSTSAVSRLRVTFLRTLGDEEVATYETEGIEQNPESGNGRKGVFK